MKDSIPPLYFTINWNLKDTVQFQYIHPIPERDLEHIELATTLAFGLLSVPHMFTKLMKPVVIDLKAWDIHIVVDNMLVLAQSCSGGDLDRNSVLLVG